MLGRLLRPKEWGQTSYQQVGGNTIAISDQNCNSFGTYEELGEPNGALCHGGRWTDADNIVRHYKACPVKHQCRAVTLAKMADGKRHLPMASDRSPSGFIASTNGLRTAPGTLPNGTGFRRPTTTTPTTYDRRMEALRNLESSLQHRYKGKFDPAATPEEQVVTPPANTPVPMSTPYAAPHPAAGMMTPTFLPMTREDIVPRLMSNIAQGMVGATGWHLLDYSRSVDMFGPWR